MGDYNSAQTNQNVRLERRGIPRERDQQSGTSHPKRRHTGDPEEKGSS